MKQSILSAKLQASLKDLPYSVEVQDQLMNAKILTGKYEEMTTWGSFILVDEHTNSTVAVGFIC